MQLVVAYESDASFALLGDKSGVDDRRRGLTLTEVIQIFPDKIRRKMATRVSRFIPIFSSANHPYNHVTHKKLAKVLLRPPSEPFNKTSFGKRRRPSTNRPSTSQRPLPLWIEKHLKEPELARNDDIYEEASEILEKLKKEKEKQKLAHRCARASNPVAPELTWARG